MPATALPATTDARRWWDRLRLHDCPLSSRRTRPVVSQALSGAFGVLPDRELGWITGSSSEITVPAGTVLCRQGDLGREVLLLLDGTVAVARDHEALGVGSAPSVLGEMSVLGRSRRVATVVASSPVTVAVATPAEFGTILARCPHFARYVAALARARWDVLVDDLLRGLLGPRAV